MRVCENETWSVKKILVPCMRKQNQNQLSILNSHTQLSWLLNQSDFSFNENAWALTRPPATCPPCQYSCPEVVKGCQDVMPWCHVTSWHHTMMSHDVKSHHKIDLGNLYRSHYQKVRKSRFSKSWPWPLTYDLDLQTRPRYYQGQCLYQFSGPYVKPFNRESAE